MTTFSTEYKKWSCYTSFWSLELTDHFDTNLDSYKYSHWSLEGKIKILRIFADDVRGTKFDEKYFQCILSEYLTNFESFSPENGIVEVSLNLNSSDCIASTIIFIDTKLEWISWELNIINQLLNYCVGVCVGGYPRSNFWHLSKCHITLVNISQSEIGVFGCTKLGSISGQPSILVLAKLYFLYFLSIQFSLERNRFFKMTLIKSEIGRKMFPHFLPNHILWSTRH